jgi:AraC-like DNA-binding protein
MKALRSHQMISGFFLEKPVTAIPQILHCGEALCSSRHQLKPHEHAGFEFVYITRGHAFWQVRGRALQQRMGDLLVTYPREQHATAAEPGVEFHLLWIGLDLDHLGPMGKRLAAQLRAGEITMLAQCHELESVMRGIFSQAAGRRPLREQVIAQYLRMFSRLLEQRLRQEEKKTAGAAEMDAEAGLYSPATNRALQFLRDQLDRRVAVKEIAAKATGGSVTRFCARFKREVGMPPAQYHQQLRLDEARQALRQPGARVTDVAMRYGFSSSQHFSTVFRSMFGVTPRGWQSGRKK